MQVTESLLLADRIVLTVRWLALLGLGVYAGLGGGIDGTAAVWLGLAGVWNLVITIISLLNRRLPQHHYLSIGADGLLAIIFFMQIQSNGSSLFYAALLPVMTGSFYFGLRGGLFIAVGAIVFELGVAITSLSLSEALGVLWLPAVVILALGAVFGFLAQQIGYQIRHQRMFEISEAQESARIERERVKALSTITSTLTSTLDYQKLLDLALDLSASAVADPEKTSGHMVCAFFLYEGDMMYVGSARRFTNSDMRATLEGREGLVSETLRTGRPAFLDDPTTDPELKRVVALRNCATIYCYPLRTGSRKNGVILFGHPEAGYFDEVRGGILEIIGRQVKVALQNARLYQQVEEEKERMMEIQEEARKKLARDLHDGPTQSVAAIAMRVNFARRMMDRDVKQAGEELFKIEDLARRTTKEIRHMLFTLRPLVLESSGLAAALESMAEKMKETFEQNVIIEVKPDIVSQLEMGKQGVMFYIAEEAVNNARKHAEAEHIWVRIRGLKDDIALLEIEDDGVGFNVGAVEGGYEHRGSLGMVNMRERTEMVNGALRLDSEEGKGTRIRVFVPITEDAAAKLRAQ